MKRSVWSCLAVLLLVGAAWSVAQEPEAQPRRQPRGILPAYYAAVVAPDQREKIYGIQQSYAEQLQKLEAEIAAIKAKRDAEVEAVLTAEQLKKVKAMADEARAKREAARKEREAAQGAAKPEPATPTAPAAGN